MKDGYTNMSFDTFQKLWNSVFNTREFIESQENIAKNPNHLVDEGTPRINEVLLAYARGDTSHFDSLALELDE